MEKQTCKNCGEESQSNYCPNCGQRNFKSRFNLSILLDWIIDSFDYRKGLVNTLISLQTKPGVLVHEFIGGKTKSYFNPFTYLLLIFTFSYILQPTSTGYYLIFIQTLFLIIAFNYMVFRRNGYNIFENIIIALFLTSECILIWLIYDLIEWFSSRFWGVPLILTCLLYSTYFNWKVFHLEKKIMVILKSLFLWLFIGSWIGLEIYLDGEFQIIQKIINLFKFN